MGRYEIARAKIWTLGEKPKVLKRFSSTYDSLYKKMGRPDRFGKSSHTVYIWAFLLLDGKQWIATPFGISSLQRRVPRRKMTRWKVVASGECGRDTEKAILDAVDEILGSKII